jgi:hypothetical protein
MEKWYKKQFHVVTKKNFISVFLWIFAIAFFLLENIMEKDRGFSLFFIGSALGQELGYLIGKAKFKN